MLRNFFSNETALKNNNKENDHRVGMDAITRPDDRDGMEKTCPGPIFSKDPGEFLIDTNLKNEKKNEIYYLNYFKRSKFLVSIISTFNLKISMQIFVI